MKRIVQTIRSFNWRLWLVLAVTLFIPALYQTLRLSLLGNLPDAWGVNIASQLGWVNLLYEILQEGLILPLYFLLGKASGSKAELEKNAKAGFLFSGGAYLLLSLLIVLFARPLCVGMASDPATLEATVSYIRWESLASAIGILSQFILVLLVTMERERYMYLLLFVRTALTMLLDTLFLSELPCSLRLGVNGIAYSNILVNAFCVAAALGFLKKEGFRLFRRGKLDTAWLREYGRIGLYSGLESFIRNLAFMLMVSRLVNVIAEQGTYWVANSFIWTWLLLPTTALYDVVKKETAAAADNIRAKTAGYLAIATLFSFLWLISIPLWKPFLQVVLHCDAYETVFHVVLISTPFYIIYIFNCIFDGTIYGRGKTQYMLFESIFTNGLYYVTMFLLWRTRRWVPTLNGIALMFGIGMAIDLIPTFALYLRLLRREGIRLR